MPAAVGAIVAAAGVLSGATTFFGFTGLTGALLAGAASFVMDSLSSALAPKQKKTDASAFESQSSARTQQIRQAITTRKIVYGEVRVSGPLIFIGSTQSNKYLHYILVLGWHEFESIDEVWFGDDVIPNDYLDANGNVISGKYSGKMRIRKHLGADGQTADTLLVSEVTEWTTNHRGRGNAYIYFRLERDRDVYTNGVLNGSAVVRGKKLYDPRTLSTRWSPNIALMTDDYLTYGPGIGAARADVGEDETSSAANSCEEMVTTQNLNIEVSSVAAGTDIITLAGDFLPIQRGDRVQVVTTGAAPGGLATATDYYVIPYQFGDTPRIKLAASLDDAIDGVAIDITSSGSGTHTIRKTGEPRYFGGGQIDTVNRLGENLRDIASGMGGTVVCTGGQWKIYAAVYRSPSVTLDESHSRAPLKVQTKVSRRDRFNTVKGIYVDPANFWQPSDYPAISDASYITDDGETLVDDLDLPFTQRPFTAQRLAKIRLKRSRNETLVEYPCNLHGLQFQPTDTLQLTNSFLGWSGKIFEVRSWRMTVTDNKEGAPVIGVDMGLRSTSSSDYSWDSSEEASLPETAATTLPDPFTVSQPVGLSIDSFPVETRDVDNLFRVVVAWDEHPNQFVTVNGEYQIQYKLSSDSVWTNVIGKIPGESVGAEVFTGQLGTDYDIRIRAINELGRKSDWALLEGFVVGTAGGVTSNEDYGNWTESLGPTIDFGNWTDSVGTTSDYGGFTV